MPLLLEDLIARVSDLADVELLCEIMDITSEDILERFSDLAELHQEDLREIFDVDTAMDIDEDEEGDEEDDEREQDYYD